MKEYRKENLISTDFNNCRKTGCQITKYFNERNEQELTNNKDWTYKQREM
jgi:hypothetical protein